MKIAHVVDSLSTAAGGMQTTVSQFAEALERLGHQVVLIGGVDAGKMNQTDSVKRILLQRYGPLKYSFLRNLKETLDREKPDVIIQHGIWSLFTIQLTRYSNNTHIPYFVVPHGMLDPYILKKKSILKKFALILYQKRNLENSILIRALNNNERDHIKAVHPLAKIEVAPNGLNWNDHIDNVDRENNTILFLGRIDDKKGVCELIEAWKSLLQKGLLPKSAKLRIAGWGDESYEIRAKLAAQGVLTIEFIGPKFGIDKEIEFKKAGAFILPSKGEGLPTAVLEAWSAGALVIMSKECNFDLDVFDRVAIETSFDALSVEESLNVYFRLESSASDEMRNSAKEYVKRYSWSNIVDEFSKKALKGLM